RLRPEGRAPRFMVPMHAEKPMGASHEPRITHRSPVLLPLPARDERGEGRGEGFLLRFMVPLRGIQAVEASHEARSSRREEAHSSRTIGYQSLLTSAATGSWVQARLFSENPPHELRARARHSVRAARPPARPRRARSDAPYHHQPVQGLKARRCSAKSLPE